MTKLTFPINAHHFHISMKFQKYYMESFGYDIMMWVSVSVQLGIILILIQFRLKGGRP